MFHKLLYVMLICTALAACAGRPPAPSGQLEHSTEPSRDSRSLPQRSEALLLALLALGVDYHDGGRSPITGFDCSGLVAHVFEQAYGIRLPRNAQGQSEAGIAVAGDQLEPGDLVFYDTLGRPNSHVGIYVGEGRFVHAPKPGASVRVESLRAAFWSKRFSGARRIEPAL